MDAVIQFFQTLITLLVQAIDLLIQLVISVLSFFLVIAKAILAALHLG